MPNNFYNHWHVLAQAALHREYKAETMTLLLQRSRLPRTNDVHVYTACENGTSILMSFMVVFSPWAFGTTQPWSIWTMNAAGYLLGLLLGLKLYIRRIKGYVPPRWDMESSDIIPEKLKARFPSAAGLMNILILLTLCILIYCAASALNAAATYDPRKLIFTYHSYKSWLPHSFDRTGTWMAFGNYLALACSFWAVTDWLAGKSDAELRPGYKKAGEIYRFLLPARVRTLLWLLCINGALLGLESIAQRLEGSGRLLFLIKPTINSEGISQFGPFHYRGNAASYFNLIWPVCLGFWSTLQSEGPRDRRQHLLLGCAIIMAASPIISSSRGGTFIAVGLMGLCFLIFIVSQLVASGDRLKNWKRRYREVGFMLLFLAGTLALGMACGWDALGPRLARMDEGFVARQQLYAAAQPIASDYPIFGIGPGSFGSVFQLYRVAPEVYWPAQLHNDWLETRITFGWIGSGLIGLALLVMLLRSATAACIQGRDRLLIGFWLALGGCLIHARFDFPFQIYSINFVFLLICALAFGLSRFCLWQQI